MVSPFLLCSNAFRIFHVLLLHFTCSLSLDKNEKKMRVKVFGPSLGAVNRFQQSLYVQRIFCLCQTISSDY